MINKDKLKGYFAGLITAALFCSTAVFAESIEKAVTAVYNNIKIVVDGAQITPTDANGNIVEPFIIDGTTYLPVRAVASALGKEVNWDGNTNTVYLGKMPESQSSYTVNSEILSTFSETELVKVNSKSVKGSFFNLLLADTATDEFMKQSSDNYSPSKTLQTMTIDSIPVAKVLMDEVSSNIKLLFSIYQDAEKTGFVNESSTKEEMNYSWNNFVSGYGEENFASFLSSHAISESDFRAFLDMNTVYSLYANKLYSDNLSKTYTDKELFDYVKTNFVKAKHILVTDQQLAEDIIEKLKKGESFDTLMKEYSTDPGQGEDGYTFTKGEMVPEFEEAAFALSAGSYTLSPVKTSYGYHIIHRYNILESWVKGNADTLKTTIAYNNTNNTIFEILNSAKIEYSDAYEKYLTTIE